MSKNIHPLGASVEHMQTQLATFYRDYREAVHKFQVEKLHECDTKAEPYKKYLDNLSKTYNDIAWQLAQEAEECPFQTWGSPMHPTSFEMSVEGITCYWDINGDYAPYEYLATWERLIETKQKEQT